MSEMIAIPSVIFGILTDTARIASHLAYGYG